MKKFLIKISSTHYKWLAAAVFLYLFSILVNQFSQRNNIKKEWKALESYLYKNIDAFEKLSSDTALLKNFLAKSESKKNFEKILKYKFGFFLSKKINGGGEEMIFWNNQESTPTGDLYYLPDGEYFRKLENGYYLCVKKTFLLQKEKDSSIAIGLIPVLYDYFVETGYLPNKFAHNSKANLRMSLTEEATALPVKGKSGKLLFFINEKSDLNNTGSSGLAILIKIISTLLLLIFIHFNAEKYTKRKGLVTGLLVLAGSLILLRIISYYVSFPLNLRQFELFDPTVYAANPLQKSLGDLIINSVMFCWIILFIWENIKDSQEDWKKLFQRLNKFIWGGLIVLLILAITFIVAKTIRSLAADSNISFDVINFFSLNLFSVLGFTELAIIAIGYYYFIRLMLIPLSVFFDKDYYLVYLGISVSGLTYLTIVIGSPLLNFFVFVLVWLLLYIRIQRIQRFSRISSRLNIASTLFWIFLYSVSITAIIIDANRDKEWEIRKRLAMKIDLQSDPYNERQLSISFAYIDDDFLQYNFSRFHNPESAQILRDSILREGGYLSRYDSRVYVFDQDGKALYKDDAESLNTLNTIVRLQSKPTTTANLYFYETSFDRFTFIFKKEARDEEGRLMGTIFIVSNPEQYGSDALYPELFRQANQNNPEESSVYSYAIYKKGILLTGPNNKYSFSTSISITNFPLNKYEKRINGKNDELWYKASNDKVVVITKKIDSGIEAITLFSYVFCAFLFLVGLFKLVAIMLKVGGDIKELKKLMQWNIRTQVHSTIIFISILSFIIIGIATISFFIQRYEQNNSEKLSSTMQIMVNEMEKKQATQKIFDDQIMIYDSVSNQDVQKLVNEVSEIHNVDVNVYDTLGNLHVTSQPLIYREGILSRKIHPLAYYHLNRLRQVQYVQEEKLATLAYLSIYSPIRDGDGRVYAYLNIPYFLSQRELKQEISNFLVTIINLNAFIFLIAGVVALFITNRVTRSFSLISEKMKDVNLGKTNEEIIWLRDDEIGELVTEYNKMVNKLEESASALAKSEREGAWREMARQVAHEIKNPLTPMKLSIQYLQRSIDNNAANVKELTTNVAKTLVEQIDHLSKIAFDFSLFANIGNTYPEKFDLKDVLDPLKALYQMNEKVEINMNGLSSGIFLFTDKTQMNRLFTNLFQNAMEANTLNEKSRIEVNVNKGNKFVQISIRDNGEGIPVVMQSHIFSPNFTTKTSGTGLGLAMCKGIVEKAGGKIWFETQKGEGATFFVDLPLAYE